MGIQQMLMSGGGGGSIAGEYFAKARYTGTGSAQHITTDLDMTGGGLTWIKNGVEGRMHVWNYDDSKQMYATEPDYEYSNAEVTSWTSTGFNLGNRSQTNFSSLDYHSWSFKKAEGFYDTVTYTGTAVGPQTLSHNLGQVPGMMLIKCTNDGSFNWNLYRDDKGTGWHGYLNNNHDNSSSSFWHTAPTSTQFTVNDYDEVNRSGYEYRAFLFAKETENLIKCGSFTGTSSDQSVAVGFKPQFLLIKKYASGDNTDWMLIDDSMATVSGEQYKEYWEFGNTATSGSSAGRVNSDLLTLSTGEYVEFTDTGFIVSSTHANLNSGPSTYFYMAIAAP